MAVNTAKEKAQKKQVIKDTDVEAAKILTFYIGEQVYGIEIQHVIEIIGVPHITRVPWLPSYIKGIINVRSKVVPVVNIRARFDKPEIPYDEKTCTVIVAYNDIQVGLIVDEVLDVLSIKKGNIAQTPDLNNVNLNHFIQYIAEMQDGVKLVLDVPKLVYENDHALSFD
jgi:purine-binding chemotaxis protein CheW